MTEKYSFSKHAKERMVSRGITDSMIMNVITSPGKTIDESPCTTIFQKVLVNDGSDILLRVFVNTCKEPNLIITAYKTTKINKYED